MARSDETGRLAVLLCTHNGARFLDRQLQSVAGQLWSEIDIYASDDGSTDSTPQILQDWQARWSKGGFDIRHGPQRGFAENFRALLADPEIDADYVSFCDQDDVWLLEKTATAVRQLVPLGDRPAVFFSRTIIVNAREDEIDRSPAFRRAPSFANALVQSIGGGNTVVLNRAGHAVVREAARLSGVVSHDWLCYLLISGVGGEVVFSQTPHVLYRQHDGNLVGSNMGWRSRLQRLVAAFGGRFVRWNDGNLSTLDACRHLLTPEALRIIQSFQAARHGPVPDRLRALRTSGVYRQTLMGQISLYLAMILNRM